MHCSIHSTRGSTIIKLNIVMKKYLLDCIFGFILLVHAVNCQLSNTTLLQSVMSGSTTPANLQTNDSTSSSQSTTSPLITTLVTLTSSPVSSTLLTSSITRTSSSVAAPPTSGVIASSMSTLAVAATPSTLSAGAMLTSNNSILLSSDIAKMTRASESQITGGINFGNSSLVTTAKKLVTRTDSITTTIPGVDSTITRVTVIANSSQTLPSALSSRTVAATVFSTNVNQASQTNSSTVFSSPLSGTVSSMSNTTSFLTNSSTSHSSISTSSSNLNMNSTIAISSTRVANLSVTTIPIDSSVHSSVVSSTIPSMLSQATSNSSITKPAISTVHSSDVTNPIVSTVVTSDWNTTTHAASTLPVQITNNSFSSFSPGGTVNSTPHTDVINHLSPSNGINQTSFVTGTLINTTEFSYNTSANSTPVVTTEATQFESSTSLVNQTTFHSYGSVDWENSTTQAATAERTDHFTVGMTTSIVTAEFPHLTTVAGSGIVTTALRGSTEFTSTSPVETTRPPVTTTIPDETSTVLPVTTTILHSTTTGVIRSGHEQNSQTGIIIGVVMGCLFGLAALLLVVFFGFRARRKHQFRRQVSPAHRPGVNNATFDMVERIVDPDENIERPASISIDNFVDHVLKLRKDTDFGFSSEYQRLQKLSPKHPMTAAELPANRVKNRYTNILPFDHSRVKLIPLDDDDDEGSDYINASYMPGYSSRREFIAAQGPMKCTNDDFWRMIWEQNICIIVMVTNLQERGREKCAQYWPADNESLFYGDVQVNLMSESSINYYVLRVFEVRLGAKLRTIRQVHFNAWPDFGCPEEPTVLIDFVTMVRTMYETQRVKLGEGERLGPTMVHCSAGVGRTGTFIVVDHLLQLIQKQDAVDIFGIVLDMRNYRNSMIQSEAQYVFTHECIKLAIEKGLHGDQIDTSSELADEPTYVNTIQTKGSNKPIDGECGGGGVAIDSLN